MVATSTYHSLRYTKTFYFDLKWNKQHTYTSEVENETEIVMLTLRILFRFSVKKFYVTVF